MHLHARQTFKADHPLARLDPRIKLISFVSLLVMVIGSRGSGFPLFIAAVSLALCLTLGVRPRLLLARFAEPLFIAATLMILKLFLSGHVTLFSMHILGLELTGHRDGLMDGLFIAARIGGAVSLTALLGLSTSFTDLMGALSWLRVPACFIEITLFAWRYIFLLFDDAQVVYAAQKNRLGYAGILRGMRSFGTLAGALVIKAFDNSQSVSVAMTQRGYDGSMPQLRHKPLDYREAACALLLLLCMGIIWII